MARYQKIIGLSFIVLAATAFLYPVLSHRPFFWTDVYFRGHDKLSQLDKGHISQYLPSPLPRPIGYLNFAKFQEKLQHPASWVQQEIQANFNQYQHFDAASVQNSYQKSLEDNAFVLFTIKDKKAHLQYKYPKLHNAPSLRLYQNLFQYLAKENYLSDVSFILRMKDQTIPTPELSTQNSAPILAVTKNTADPFDQASVLIPDWMNLENWPRLQPKLDYANTHSHWENKHNTIFWRGGVADVSGYRHAIVKLGQQLQDSSLDVQFTYGGYQTTDFLSPEDHVPYKFQLTIDGHTAAWERPVWQLYTNCVMLKQFSVLNQWFYPALKAGIHYIDVGNNPNEIFNILSQYNDTQLHDIAMAGHQFAAEQLSPEDMVAYLTLVLQEYERRQHSAES